MRRYIVTGAPGAGKTVILGALRERGYRVVDEAATDVIAREQARGVAEPWRDDGFVDAIVLLQRRRQRLAPPDTVQLYDRSPLCTLALAHYSGRAVSRLLDAELARIRRDRVYEKRVFFVCLLGFVTPSAARRITFEESTRFADLHRDAYRSWGYELVDVPPGTVADRAALVHRYIEQWS